MLQCLQEASCEQFDLLEVLGGDRPVLLVGGGGAQRPDMRYGCTRPDQVAEVLGK